MCGISGYIGDREAIPVILEGLRRLEYRGYDSAGLAIVSHEGLKIHKTQGRVAELASSMPDMGSPRLAIGHTRWATHGEPSTANAHPHVDGEQRFAIVHNGIIENATALRAQLEADGFVFTSTTDTEVLAHLIAAAGTDDVEEAVQFALGNAKGTYGIAVVGAATPDRIVIARNGSPVVIGIGDGEHFVASDVAAFATWTRRVVYLEDHELAVVRAESFSTRGLSTGPRMHVPTTFSWEASRFETGDFAHFMHKEIHEQPATVERLVTGRTDARTATVDVGDLHISMEEARSCRRVTLFGCGSAYYAALAGARVIERLTGISADAEAASEFRYREPIIDPSTLYIAISQSGETLDTLQAVWQIQRHGGRVIAVVNVLDSSIARACGDCLYLQAGLEISVTSTKTFTSTIVALSILALDLRAKRGLPGKHTESLLVALAALPANLQTVLGADAEVARIAGRFAHASGIFFIGRLSGYPIALEGSQKLKEVSYLHAEAYPCGELKHGPLALIAPDFPTVAIVPNDALFAKNLGTLCEIRARRGPIIAIGHSEELKDFADEVVLVPKSAPEVDPLLMLLPLQLLAYHAAVVLGHDVDRPRNLAKSVTVE